jgi:hypothetical protein
MNAVRRKHPSPSHAKAGVLAATLGTLAMIAWGAHTLATNHPTPHPDGTWSGEPVVKQSNALAIATLPVDPAAPDR